MKKSIIILNSINEKKDQITKLRVDNKLDEAIVIVNEVANLRKEYAIEVELENKPENKVNAKNNKDAAKTLTNKQISNDLRGVLKGEPRNDTGDTSIFTDGKATFAVETVPELISLIKGYNPLRPETRQITVSGNSGTIPKKTGEIKELSKLVKGQAIIKTSQNYEGVPYELSSIGSITSIPEGDIIDSVIDLTAQAFLDFSESSTLTEDIRIVNLMKTAKTVVGKTYKDIILALDTLPPSVRNKAKIYANPTSRSYITNLENKMGSPICGTDIQNSASYTLRGYNIFEVNPSALANTDDYEFYVGSLQSIGMPNKDAVRLTVSHDSSFDSDEVELKIVEQLDVIDLNVEDCLVKVTIPMDKAPVTA